MRFIIIIPVFLLMTGRCDKSIPEMVWRLGEPDIKISGEPLFIEKEQNDLISLMFTAEGTEDPLSLNSIEIVFTDESSVSSLAEVSCWFTGVAPGVPTRELFATEPEPGTMVTLNGNLKISSGRNCFVIGFRARSNADLLGKLVIQSITLSFSDRSKKEYFATSPDKVIRYAKVLRAAGQDGSDTYRIPGLVTTNAGTLIAVYDIRYNNSRDLQDNIDIGMSRSTDGGETWEPMKVIMDMEEWGGKPEAENGVGDPCVLVDRTTGTIWVAALWMNGFPATAAWNSSGPGIDPSVTGQFLLVKSEDDGLTWSEEINITSQIKKPGWRLLLQGPGNGISLSDGTIVFPAQFRDETGLPYSTIIRSSDHGETWHIGTGARGNTTEAQCVQLSDGSIMLNMRDNRNSSVKDATNGRAVAVTHNLGQTWETHPSSNSALPEPVCMASLIAADISIEGTVKKVLFFSNPDDKYERKHMTIKASIDQGMTWPENYHVELYESSGFGYSCLTMTDEKTVGILYEGIKELYFQKIPVNEILNLK